MTNDYNANLLFISVTKLKMYSELFLASFKKYIGKPLVGFFLFFTVLGSSAYAQTFTVTSLLDDSGGATLRDAIVSVNGASNNVIEFSVTGTITLTSDLDPIIFGVAINGPGADLLTIDGDGTYSIFQTTGINFSINNITLNGGLASLEGGAAISYGGSGILDIDGVVFSNNASSGGGKLGGALQIKSGTASIDGCYFVGNSHSCIGCDSGGAIYMAGNTTITNSTFYNNQGSRGGAITVDGSGVTLNLVHSTISGNNADDNGGGIWAVNNATVNLNYSIVHGNTTLGITPADIDDDASLASHYDADDGGTDTDNVVGVVSGTAILNAANVVDGSSNFTLAGTPTDNGGTGNTFVVSGTAAVNAGAIGTVTTDQTGATRTGSQTLGALEINVDPVITRASTAETIQDGATLTFTGGTLISIADDDVNAQTVTI
ncbi:MAG: hypothetical protein ACJA2S_003125, partial [Cyclobacteriaceae bacterium]